MVPRDSDTKNLNRYAIYTCPVNLPPMKRGSSRSSGRHDDDENDPEHSEAVRQLKEKVNDLRSAMSSEAQKIIHEIMPKKVSR